LDSTLIAGVIAMKLDSMGCNVTWYLAKNALMEENSLVWKAGTVNATAQMNIGGNYYKIIFTLFFEINHVIDCKIYINCPNLSLRIAI